MAKIRVELFGKVFFVEQHDREWVMRTEDGTLVKTWDSRPGYADMQLAVREHLGKAVTQRLVVDDEQVEIKEEDWYGKKEEDL